MKENAHKRLKWALSTAAAVASSLFVIALETQ